MATHPARYPAPRSRASVLSAAAHVLALEPSRSLTEVAAAIGIGRTTLHRMFPTRRDLLLAIAHDALADLTEVYAAAGLPDTAGADTAGADEVMGAIGRVVQELIPRGARLLFLLRTPELAEDDDLARRAAEVDGPLHAWLRAARSAGIIRSDVPAWWAVETLLAAVYVAWEQIELGRLAPLDATPLVLSTWTTGVAHDPRGNLSEDESSRGRPPDRKHR